MAKNKECWRFKEDNTTRSRNTKQNPWFVFSSEEQRKWGPLLLGSDLDFFQTFCCLVHSRPERFQQIDNTFLIGSMGIAEKGSTCLNFLPVKSSRVLYSTTSWRRSYKISVLRWPEKLQRKFWVFFSKMGRGKVEKKNQQWGIVWWVAEVKIETT